MTLYEKIKSDPDLKTYITEADESLFALGYTEHSFAHVNLVSQRCESILSALGYDSHTVELGKIASYLHDIGNMVNRINHSETGAVMAFRLLDKMRMPPCDIAKIVTAIGNHDEGTGVPVSAIAAALIIADKSDVRRSRVRNNDFSTFDIHDRVNYSVKSSKLSVSADKKVIALALEIDTNIGSIMEYFEIFLGRMLLCTKAAAKLGVSFELYINRQKIM